MPAPRRFSPASHVLAAIAVGTVVGASVGIGGFTFVYAKGASYLTNDPRACANCHIMQGQLDAWSKSSHHDVAVCNDCHAPHDVVGKYLTKAVNGFFHSYAFTTGRFPEPIRITERNRRITEGTCRHCHEQIVSLIDPPHRGRSPLACLHCHANVGHLEMVRVGSTAESD